MHTAIQMERRSYYGRIDQYRFGNVVNTNKIVTIINPDSAPAKRIVQRAKDSERIVDATQGRRTKSIILTDSEHVILSALQPETLAGRFQNKEM